MSKLFIPNLLEFLYDCFDSRGKDYLFERLSREELKKVKSKAKIKSFVEKGKFEDIMILLSKVNYGVGFTIWDKEKEKKKVVQDVLIANLEVPESDLTKHIIKSKIFSTIDINVIRALQLTSKVSHSNVWAVNRKYYELKPEKPGFNQRNIVNLLDAKRHFEWYVETIATAMCIGPLLETYKLTESQFEILLFLQNSPNGATVEAINKRVHKQRGLKLMLAKMYKTNLIDYSPDKTVISIGVNGLVAVDAIISKFP